MFAQRTNVANPRFGRMLVDVVRFNRRARALLDRHQAAVAAGDETGVARLEEWTLDDLVAQTGCSPMFVTHYLVPLGAAIWSADPDRFTRFPAVSWSRFMDNHGLLHVRGTPHWRTVTGGSRRYVDALIAPFADRIRLATPVTKIRRHRRPDGGVEVEVLSSPAGPERFDSVILANHSDQALRLLSDPSDAERDILGALTYQPNVATLHTDARFLPRRPAARACWNAHVGAPAHARDGRPATSLTYWMNALQGIESDRPLLVTLNRHEEIDPSAVLGRYDYDHPMFDLDALAAQRRRSEIQGVDGTWFAGAYWGYGFHEDGVRSGLDVCRSIDADP